MTSPQSTQTALTAIVTGGSAGLGLALTGALRSAGWRVVFNGRRPDLVAEAARATGALGVPGDVTDADHRLAVVQAALDLGGRIDLLVNNAGSLGPSPLPSLRHLDVAQLRSTLEANTVAPLALAQAALPYLVSSNGALLNITSDAAVEGYPGWGAYGASKAALEQWSNVLAAEEPSLRVWWVDPGDMRTQMHQDAFPGEDISDRPLPATVAPALLSLLAQRPPSGRLRAGDLLAKAIA
jgi:NAD(P)-dependent dehydrogenase (short-subunit alcohol dehydrogenase family)